MQTNKLFRRLIGLVLTVLLIVGILLYFSYLTNSIENKKFDCSIVNYVEHSIQMEYFDITNTIKMTRQITFELIINGSNKKKYMSYCETVDCVNIYRKVSHGEIFRCMYIDDSLNITFNLSNYTSYIVLFIMLGLGFYLIYLINIVDIIPVIYQIQYINQKRSNKIIGQTQIV